MYFSFWLIVLNINYFSFCIIKDGLFEVDTSKLEAGEEYLRETSSYWKDKVKESMKNNPFIQGSILVAVVDVAKKDFDKKRVSLIDDKIALTSQYW